MRHGSLTNLLMPNATEVPAVGSAATVSFWTDRHAATVIEATETTITVQQDKATRVLREGEVVMSDSQTYTYEADPKGAVYIFTKRKDGRFYQKGQAMGSGPKLTLGYRDEHYDYGF